MPQTISRTSTQDFYGSVRFLHVRKELLKTHSIGHLNCCCSNKELNDTMLGQPEKTVTLPVPVQCGPMVVLVPTLPHSREPEPTYSFSAKEMKGGALKITLYFGAKRDSLVF